MNIFNSIRMLNGIKVGSSLIRIKNLPDINSYAYSSIERPDKFYEFSRKRKRDYLGGRLCAQKAIFDLQGYLCNSISINEDRSPKWPIGLVGSITHSNSFISAVVGNNQDMCGIGIDIEEIIPSSKEQDLRSLILCNSELLNRLFNTIESNLLLTIIFSAKESIFKCLYPITKVPFYFLDVEIVSIDFQKKEFVFRLNKDLSLDFQSRYESKGFFYQVRNSILTGVMVRSK